MNMHAQRLESLRALMKSEGVAACLILTSDPHLSEYLPDFWKSRKWLSGFTGSAGSLVVTQDYAALWADGRYWIQAEKELKGSGIELQKQTASNTFVEWLSKNLAKGDLLATDFKVLPLFVKRELEAKGLGLVSKDLVASIWTDRPALPNSPIYEHLESPHSRQEKLALVRKELDKKGATHNLLVTLDDIAWLCNLRGSDVPYNPVFLSFFLLSKDEATLFTDLAKIPSSLRAKLEGEGLGLAPYDSLDGVLAGLRGARVLLDSLRTTSYLADLVAKNNDLIDDMNPSQLLKACKSDKELDHIKEAMVHDGVALCKLFAWLEEALASGQRVSELDIGEKATHFRSQSPLYISDSFSTIAGFNANGAEPHYGATKESFSYLDGQGFLLVDSGGQYTKGTTDITRVVPIGQPTAAQKRDYTLVLKAHIALARASFPAGISMPLLDSITRAPLWKEGLNYIHGTGHGVGYFLNVHEGPQVISYLANPLPRMQAMAGMVSSIEPGVYRAGKWGVRLENLVANVPVKNPKETDFGDFLCFETLTLCPFEPSCIDLSILTCDEKDWVDDYHSKVKVALEDKLEGKAKEWLLRRVAPLAR